MISEELQKLRTTKAAIKLALIDKGLNPTDEFATYADNIANISGGDLDFSIIGTSTDFITPLLQAGLAEALSIYDDYNGVTDYALYSSYSENNNLKFFPKLTMSIVGTSSLTSYLSTGMYYTFLGAHNLKYFDGSNITLYNPSYYCSFNGTFFGCSTIEKVILPNVKINSLLNTFNICYDLKSIDFNHSIYSLGTSTTAALGASSLFYNCLSLEEIKNAENIDLNTANTLDSAFNGCLKLQRVPFAMNNLAATTIYRMFYNCKSLVVAPDIYAPKLGTADTYGLYVFYGCSMLTENGVVNLPTAKNVAHMFEASGLVKFDGTKFSIPKVSYAGLDALFSKCGNLKRVENFTLPTASTGSYTGLNGSSTSNMFYTAPNVRYIHFTNLGQVSGLTVVYFYNNSNFPRYFGVNSADVPDAYNSLQYTLVRDSFDRVAAGYSKCTVHISTSTAAVITNEDMAAITAKGYTITTHS